MEKTFKFRIYPTKQQEELIQKTFGCVRFVYNLFLSRRKAAYADNRENVTFIKCCKELTLFKKGFVWLQEPDKGALQNALRDLDKAFCNFFKKTHKYPKFKTKRNRHKSYRTNSTTVSVLNGYIKMPKLGLVKYRDNQMINGRILNATVKQTPDGKYYIFICCANVKFDYFSTTRKYVGVDFGLKNFVTISDGTFYMTPSFLKKSLKRLARLQRKMDKKKYWSCNWEKARIQVAKMFSKVLNQRQDFLQKLSKKMIVDYDFIAIEDIAIENMLKNHNLARSVLDASWYDFTKQLEYKAKWYGKILIKIDRFYPSSQLCNVCGYRNKKTKGLNIRSWICPKCGTNHDRDINASINILKKGMKNLGIIQ